MRAGKILPAGSCRAALAGKILPQRFSDLRQLAGEQSSYLPNLLHHGPRELQVGWTAWPRPATIPHAQANSTRH